MSATSLWFGLFFALSVIALVLIPSSQLRRSLPFGVVGGGLLYYVVNLAAVPLLHLWTFTQGAVSVTGIPVMSVLACIPGAMLFQWLVERSRSPWTQVGIVTAGGAGLALVDRYALSIGALHYGTWNLLSTLGLAGLTLAALAYYIDETRVGGPSESS